MRDLGCEMKAASITYPESRIPYLVSTVSCEPSVSTIIMKVKKSCLLVAGLLMVAGGAPVRAQSQTVGLFVHDERAAQGYTLLAPMFHPSTYLIDNEGQVVHTWEHRFLPGSAVYLLPNGNLLRTARITNHFGFGGRGGVMREISWDGEVVWEFDYSDSLHALHHDVAGLPNGNVLMIAYEYRSEEEAVAAGRDLTLHPMPTGAIWPEQIIEVRPIPPDSGEIVWQWRVWDHLIQDRDSTKANFGVVENHPELIDINWGPAPTADWLHFNSVNYNEGLDQIMISSPGFDEIWIIDHSTTTEEAAGHVGGRSGKGGDLLYRWGNPASYRKGTGKDRHIFFAHDAQWVEPGLPGEGNILVFNNGLVRSDSSNSSIFEIVPPLNEDGSYRMTANGAFDPGDMVWQYAQPDTFFSGFASGQHRLPNGNTLIAEAQSGRIFEVTTGGEIVWQYVNPVTDDGPLAQGDSIPPSPTSRPEWLANSVFRAYRYPASYPAFDGKDLTPKGLIELMPTAIEGPSGIPDGFALSQNYPNPFNPSTAIIFRVPRLTDVTLAVYNMLGQRVKTLVDRPYGRGTHLVHFDATGLPSGVYFYRLEAGSFTATQKMLLVR